MIEVFKTNITNATQARIALELLHESFPGISANIDLGDCDRILRVVSKEIPLHNEAVIFMLKLHGIVAEVLPDEIPQLVR